MSWLGIHGHDATVECFRNSLRQGRFASTFLFVGPPGIGKRSVAVRLAQSLLCQQATEHELNPCQRCPDCLQVSGESHPDLELVGLPDGRSFIPLELLIGDKEHRMRAGLCHRMSLKPALGGRKIAIIDDADHLNIEGANCLLKTLEEPPPRAVIILIGSSEQRQLPTILSRSQVVRFQPLEDRLIQQLLVEQGITGDENEAQELAALAEGSLARARDWSDKEMRQTREELLNTLSQADWDSVATSKWLWSCVESAGTDTSSRRQRTKKLAEAAAVFYRQIVRQLSGAPASGDPLLLRAVEMVTRTWPAGVEAAMQCASRCLEAQVQVDANANLNTLVSCWVDDLNQVSRGIRTG